MPRRRFRLMAGLAAVAVVALALFLAWPEFELSYRAGELDLKWGEALADAPLTTGRKYWPHRRAPSRQ